MTTLRHEPGSGPRTALGRTAIGGRTFRWGERTFVMGIVNVTPDSFSGDGLVQDPGDEGHVAAALALAGRMVAEGADLLDVGGESTRPGHTGVDAVEERRRVVPVVAALRAAFPDVPVSVDTTKSSVAAAALDAGAAMINDIWGVADDDALVRLAAECAVPIVLMHNRAEPRYLDLMTEILADLERAIERALRVGCTWDRLIVDPGFGFGKTAEHNLALLRDLDALRVLGRPVLLGTSRKSTSVGCWTCRRTSASRRPSRRPRWGSAAASTSSVSTTCRPMSGSPG